VVCEVDLKVGGTWRFVMRKLDGTEMGMRGVYREIVPPERLVHTETFDDFAWPERPGEALVTTVLVEHGGKTTLHRRQRGTSCADRSPAASASGRASAGGRAC